MKRKSAPKLHAQMYIVRKYVKAFSAIDAIRKEKNVAPRDVFIDDDWRKNQTDNLADAIGFKDNSVQDYE